MCSCIFITGFFCGGVKYNTHKNSNQENSLNTRVEDMELPEVNTGMVIKPNIAYEDVKLQ